MTPKIVDVACVSMSDFQLLVKHIETAMRQGFQPAGPVQAISHGGSLVYTMTMFKYETVEVKA